MHDTSEHPSIALPHLAARLHLLDHVQPGVGVLQPRHQHVHHAVAELRVGLQHLRNGSQ